MAVDCRGTAGFRVEERPEAAGGSRDTVEFWVEGRPEAAGGS